MATNTVAFFTNSPDPATRQIALVPERAPTDLWGQGTPDGDREPFLSAQKGSIYRQVDATDDAPLLWLKVDEGGDDADWVVTGGGASAAAIFDVEHLLLGADGAALAAAETAGDFFRQVGTNQLYIQGEASLSETEVSVGWLEFTLPHNYVSGGAITLRAVVDITGAGTPGTCTVDFEARLSDNDGAVGSDLVTTAATAVTTTAGAKDFVVTPTGLVPGSKLVIKLTTSIAESAGSAIQALITKLQVLCQTS
jgi:hypothetical protein